MCQDSPERNPESGIAIARVWWPGNLTELQLSGAVVLLRRVDLPESGPQEIPPEGVLARGLAVERLLIV
ncbi:hypothetical protein B296_00002991 [Ensete ventricosum]|uniref:Uncharacterized protein n=1 Tax=Ensete ventricosum TaxID=4639 RepID=A0A427ASW5_ENSVE|nr:hypothetical protein B296_00002991 [Ensete ventricosum]